MPCGYGSSVLKPETPTQEPVEVPAPPAPEPIPPAPTEPENPEGTPEQQLALQAGVEQIEQRITELFGETEMPDNLQLNDEERAIIENIRSQKASAAATTALRETREQLAERVLSTTNADVIAMPAADRDKHLAELTALLSDQVANGL